MRCLTSLFFVTLLIVSGCSKPAAKTPAPDQSVAKTADQASETTAGQASDCPWYYYFYNQEKVTLRQRPQTILVGFRPEMTTEAKATLLKRYPEYENISPAQTAESGPFHIIKLKPSTTCQQALGLITQLKAQPEVIFANPVFHSPARLGQQFLWLGLTSEILVTVKSPENVQQIKEMISQTNTRLVDTIGETTFLIEATKTSKGNALEMANLFHEQPYVLNSEPNFYMAAREGDVTAPSRR